MIEEKSAEYAARDKIETILKAAFEDADKQKITPSMKQFNESQITLKTMLTATLLIVLISGITALAVVSTCLSILK
jgi:hypothetical protein